MKKRQKKKNTNHALQNYLNDNAAKKDIHVLNTYGNKFIREKYGVEKETLLWIHYNNEKISKMINDLIETIAEYVNKFVNSFRETFLLASKLIDTEEEVD